MSSSTKDSQIKSHEHYQSALPALLDYREKFWTNHCEYCLRTFLIPYFQKNQKSTNTICCRQALLIENRISNQWLFTILNTILMTPDDTQIILITDQENKKKGQDLIKSMDLDLNISWMIVDDLWPNTLLGDQLSFNRLMKSSLFWSKLTCEELLLVQTDSLIVEKVSEYFFKFAYLGAPFLPTKRVEYFQDVDKQGKLSGFFGIETTIHANPHPDLYPCLNGNGGLSIRHRSLMERISIENSSSSPKEEHEDVFFSRHLKKYIEPAPLSIADTFACESIYNPKSIGSHAGWKYWSTSDLAEHFDRHIRQLWTRTRTSNSNSLD